MASTADVPILIVSENSSSERRISPSWTIAQLKGRLDPVTGIPASCQGLSLRIGSQSAQPIQAADEESTTLVSWPLQAYSEIRVGQEKCSFCHLTFPHLVTNPKRKSKARLWLFVDPEKRLQRSTLIAHVLRGLTAGVEKSMILSACLTAADRLCPALASSHTGPL